ncbi:GlxA family transcriptional regulator [Marivivens sp. LCG002]|uniref:GlxA family transcriptional regulator n=1 Tax=Marivivens sp. LCG002 TaxID=3051171 RepID=UPI0025530D48|nr:GlxA family transcriptional regulator [Marivivens sp. LCG002]WIV49626.1 GlxA family transcriptional regulator [Marivivens sp. LCG002]
MNEIRSIIPFGVEYVPVLEKRETQDLVFCLASNFTLLAFSSAIEPLRIANQLAQKPLYRWEVRSADGEPVTSSAGLSIAVDGDCSNIPSHATVLICAGNSASRNITPAHVALVNRHYRHGGTVGGICTGAFALAKAGILTGRNFTLHWENQSEFKCNFENLAPTRHRFEIDRRVMTCGGGAASIDMMVELISSHYGKAFAFSVAEMCLRQPSQAASDDQRSSLSNVLGSRHPILLLQVVKYMQDNLEDLLTIDQLVDLTGYSRRHIERVFKENLGLSPYSFYRELRLDHARVLLSTTNKPLIEVAIMSGFNSVHNFSRRFKEKFGVPPSHYFAKDAISGRARELVRR